MSDFNRHLESLPLEQRVGIERATRRQFLGSLSLGLGAASLSQWMTSETTASNRLVTGMSPEPPTPNFAPKAKRVIFLCMAGGPSHLETFDPKPRLLELDGQPMPESFTRGLPIAQLQGKPLTCLGSRASFRQHGRSGQWISDHLPHIATCADDIAIVNSMVTEQINHDPAHTFMNTGSIIPGRPSMGS